MVLNRKLKLQRKQRRDTKRFAAGCGTRKSKRTGVLQYGGVSPACVFDGSSSADVLYRNSGVNIHNTNPQASLDLDNKFMNYGGPVPLGSNIMQGGSANCGDEGRGGAGNGKSETFKQYLDSVANQYMVGGAASNPGNLAYEELKNPEFMNTGVESTTTLPNNTTNPGSTTSTVPSTTNSFNKNKEAPSPNKLDKYNTIIPPSPQLGNNKSISSENQEIIPNMEADPNTTIKNFNTNPKPITGGGFSTDPAEYIAGLPVYKAYDDCCPPAIVNNQLVQGAPDQPVCGLGAISGGSRRRRTSTRSRKHTRSSNNNKFKSRRSEKRKINNRRSRRQRGGGSDFVYSAIKSTPAPFANAFNGPQGVFRYPDDMTTRAFDEYQPNYSVNAI